MIYWAIEGEGVVTIRQALLLNRRSGFAPVAAL